MEQEDFWHTTVTKLIMLMIIMLLLMLRLLVFCDPIVAKASREANKVSNKPLKEIDSMTWIDEPALSDEIIVVRQLSIEDIYIDRENLSPNRKF